MLKEKTIILGVTGSIAAYKIADLASMLVKQGCDVHVIMTKNGSKFITPITFETLTGNKCLIDTFDRDFQFDVKHISLAKKADLFMVAPASANIIAKLAYGIADDMLTTTILACKCKKIVAPAMNTNMYQNIIVQSNLKKLEEFGFEIVKPAVGMLACKDVGEGKLPEPRILYECIEKNLKMEKDMKGLKVLVTAGPTCEPIDPVRYITNHSSGKMGYSIAKMCMLRGADVVLVTGKTNIKKPNIENIIETKTADDMFNAVKSNFKNKDIIFMAAAVADYTPKYFSDEKIKKSDNDMHIELKRTRDILKYIGDNKGTNQFICGFSMETQNMIENSKSKLIKKNVDMIVANNLKQAGAGFETDTNIVTIITKNGIKQLEKMPKEDVANSIIDIIIKSK